MKALEWMTTLLGVLFVSSFLGAALGQIIVWVFG